MTDPLTDSLQRLGGTDSYERTNELTKRVITLRGHLSEADARVAGEPRTRLHIRRTEPGVWAYVVVQADRREIGPVGWGWSRSWSETLVRGLASLDVNTRFPLERSR